MFGTSLKLYIDICIITIIQILGIVWGINKKSKKLFKLYTSILILLASSLVVVQINNHNIILAIILLLLYMCISISIIVFINKWSNSPILKGIFTYIQIPALLFFFIPFAEYNNLMFIGYDSSALSLVIIVNAWSHIFAIISKNIKRREANIVFFLISSSFIITLLLVIMLPPTNPFSAFFPVGVFFLILIIGAIQYKRKGYKGIITTV